jgi:hypothetical protein
MAPSSPDYCTFPSPTMLRRVLLLTALRLRARRLPHSNPATNPRCLQTRSPENPPRPRPRRLPRARLPHEEIPAHKRRLLHPLRRHQAPRIRPRAPHPRSLRRLPPRPLRRRRRRRRIRHPAPRGRQLVGRLRFQHAPQQGGGRVGAVWGCV